MSAASPVKDLAMAQYVPSLKQVAVLRLLKQLSEVYSTMHIKELAALLPFMSFGDVESVVVDAVKYDYLQVKQNTTTAVGERRRQPNLLLGAGTSLMGGIMLHNVVGCPPVLHELSVLAWLVEMFSLIAMVGAHPVVCVR